MNTTRPEYGNAQSYDLKLPHGFTGGRVYDFVSGKELPVTAGVVPVGPRSTVVVDVGESADAPPMATRLVAASRTAGGVTVRWQHAAGATRYIVKRAVSPDGPYVAVGQTAGRNSFLDTGAKGSAAYFYKVAGADNNGVGLDSPAAPVAPPSPELLAWLDRLFSDAAAPPEAAPGLTGRSSNSGSACPGRWPGAAGRMTCCGPPTRLAPSKPWRRACGGRSGGRSSPLRPGHLLHGGGRGPGWVSRPAGRAAPFPAGE